jgi:hypothetical protein
MCTNSKVARDSQLNPPEPKRSKAARAGVKGDNRNFSEDERFAALFLLISLIYVGAAIV